MIKLDELEVGKRYRWSESSIYTIHRGHIIHILHKGKMRLFSGGQKRDMVVLGQCENCFEPVRFVYNFLPELWEV